MCIMTVLCRAVFVSGLWYAMSERQATSERLQESAVSLHHVKDDVEGCVAKADTNGPHSGNKEKIAECICALANNGPNVLADCKKHTKVVMEKANPWQCAVEVTSSESTKCVKQKMVVVGHETIEIAGNGVTTGGAITLMVDLPDPKDAVPADKFPERARECKEKHMGIEYPNEPAGRYTRADVVRGAQIAHCVCSLASMFIPGNKDQNQLRSHWEKEFVHRCKQVRMFATMNVMPQPWSCMYSTTEAVPSCYAKYPGGKYGVTIINKQPPTEDTVTGVTPEVVEESTGLEVDMRSADQEAKLDGGGEDEDLLEEDGSGDEDAKKKAIEAACEWTDCSHGCGSGIQTREDPELCPAAPGRPAEQLCSVKECECTAQLTAPLSIDDHTDGTILAGHQIDCGERGLTSWQMKQQGSEVRFEYVCCDLPFPIASDQCTEHKPAKMKPSQLLVADISSGECVENWEPIACGENQALRSWRVDKQQDKDGNPDIEFVHSCCNLADPIPEDQCTWASTSFHYAGWRADDWTTLKNHHVMCGGGGFMQEWKIASDCYKLDPSNSYYFNYPVSTRDDLRSRDNIRIAYKCCKYS